MQTRCRFSFDQQCDVDDVNKNKAHNEDTLSTRCWAKLRYRQCRRSKQYKRQYVESMFTRCRFSLECRLCRRCKQEKRRKMQIQCQFNVGHIATSIMSSTKQNKKGRMQLECRSVLRRRCFRRFIQERRHKMQTQCRQQDIPSII